MKINDGDWTQRGSREAVPWLELLLGQALRPVIRERPHPQHRGGRGVGESHQCRGLQARFWLPAQETFTPIQPARQERESSRRGGLGAALLRKGEMVSQGFTRHNKLGEASLAREGTKAPVEVFYILFVQHAHFLMCIFILVCRPFSPTPTPRICRDFSGSPLPAFALMCDVRSWMCWEAQNVFISRGWPHKVSLIDCVCVCVTVANARHCCLQTDTLESVCLCREKESNQKSGTYYLSV